MQTRTTSIGKRIPLVFNMLTHPPRKTGSLPELIHDCG
jgi:hypothetical protein